MCFLLRCLALYESKVGVMREDDWNGGCGERRCRKGGCDERACGIGGCGRLLGLECLERDG